MTIKALNLVSIHRSCRRGARWLSAVDPAEGGGNGAAEGGGIEPDQRRHTLSAHSSRGDPKTSVCQTTFLSSSGNKTSGAGPVPLSGTDYQIITRTRSRSIPRDVNSHSALRIQVIYSSEAEILEDGSSPRDISPSFGHCGSSAGRLH